MQFKAILSLGSNIGDRSDYLQKALLKIEEYAGKILKKSSIYETEPWGNTDQPLFYNMVVEIETSLFPWKLLHTLQSIETSLGRTRETHWGPRTIDIDIIDIEGIILKSVDLNIPHPYFDQRDFVLVPLREILAGFTK
ncbi:MAG: 2-amino-4-hydroxy-6-hydroxymethyldihydropteridine diphosphokinase [Leadbetterella sp.]